MTVFTGLLIAVVATSRIAVLLDSTISGITKSRIVMTNVAILLATTIALDSAAPSLRVGTSDSKAQRGNQDSGQ